MMPPSECPQAMVRVGLPVLPVEHVERAHLVRQRLWMAHPVLAYDEPASAYPWLEHPARRDWIPASCAGLAAARRHVAVAVQEQRPVPVPGRALEQVCGTVRQRAVDRGHRPGRAAAARTRRTTRTG